MVATASPERVAFDVSTDFGTGSIPTAGGGVLALTRHQLMPAAYDGDTVAYAIDHQSVSEAEVGFGVYSSVGDQITRGAGANILYSTNSGSAVDFSEGTKRVRILFTGADHESVLTTLAGLGALAVLDSVDTAQIDDDAVTPDKMADTAVTPGSYTTADITVDQQGRITAAASGVGSVTSTVIQTVRKGSVGTIAVGQAVYVSGYNAGTGFTEVELADADNTALMPALGIASTAITNATEGEVVVSGEISGLNTSAFTAGDQVFVGTTAGTLSNTRPTGATEAVQKMGVVLRSHTTNGVILVIGAGRSNDTPNTLLTDLRGGSNVIQGYRNLKYDQLSGDQTLSAANFEESSTLVHTGGSATYTVPARVGASEGSGVTERLILHNAGAGTITLSASGVTFRGETTVTTGTAVELEWDYDGSTSYCSIAPIRFTAGDNLTWDGSTLDVTGLGALATLATVDTAQIDDEAVTYAKMQHTVASRVLGRGSAGGTGDVQELTLGSNISISGTAIQVTTLDTTLDAAGQIIDDAEIRDAAETTAAVSTSGAITRSYAVGHLQQVTLTGNATSLTISNPPASGKGGWITFIIVQDATGGRTWAHPSGIDWPGGTAPTMSSGANDVDIITYITRDGGTTWYGFEGGIDFS